MSNNKTIAKNTLFLYFRMFITMGVGLYTSRLVLAALGVEDYGTYGLVGGIVTMFSFMNSAMAAATQRYLSFDLGKNDLVKLKKTFNATLHIHILIAILVVILAETVGLWFVNYKLNLPAQRMVAVNWVYQFSIFTFVLAIIQVPYNALLIAREHMNIYAYMSILETVLKLIIVFILVVLDLDKLILYAVLTFFVTFIVNILYKIYCKKHFKESEYVFYYDKNYYKELLSYSGWNLFGSIAVLARGQGGNILLNLFFGPIANAAYGLTIIVQGIISSFVSNFQVAVNPQIIKMYSIGKIDSSINLIYKTAKFSFFGMLILVTPFIMNDDYILRLWLNDVPQYTSEFIKLALIYSMIDCISNPLVTGAQATGKIKWYQITLGILIFLTLPITWVLFKCFRGPFHLFEVLIINSVIALIFRIIFLKKMIGLNLLDFFKNVFARIGLVLMIITIVYKLIPFDKANNVLALMSQTIIIVLTILAVILTFGLSASERKMMKEMLTIKFKLP